MGGLSVVTYWFGFKILYLENIKMLLKIKDRKGLQKQMSRCRV